MGDQRSRLASRCRLGVAALAVSGLATTGLVTTATGTAGAAKPPIYFGAVLALSGSLASIEQPNLQGLEAGIDLVNKHGGVLGGRKIKLVSENDGSTSTKVLPAFQALSATKLSFVEAEVIPNYQNIMLPYLKQEKIISIETTTGPTLFTPTKNPYNFGTFPGAGEVQATVAAVKALAAPAAPKVAILNTGNTTDALQAKQIGTGVTKLGGSVVYTGTVPVATTDATAQVALAQHAGANVLVAQTSSCPAIATAIATLGWTTVNAIGGGGCNSVSQQEAVPPSVAKQWHTIGERTYLRTTSGLPAVIKPLIPALKKYGTITDLFISTAAASVASVMAWAINEAHSTATNKVLKVLEHIGKYKIPASDLFGLPNAEWTTATHSYTHATRKTFFALLSPGTPQTGTYLGKPLTVPSTTPT